MDIFTCMGRLPEKEVLVAGNFSDRSQHYNLDGKAGDKITGNYEWLNLSNGRVVMHPYEAVVLELL